MLIDDNLLDEVAAEARASERLRMNRNLHLSLDEKVQRMLNALEPGTSLPIHRHRHTAETYVLLRGRNYGLHIPQGQWHTLEVKESAVILEVKEGPYAPLTAEDLLV